MGRMDEPTHPRDTAGLSELETLGHVAALIRTATRCANRAAGNDLFSPWVDVAAETVTAAGYLADVSEPTGATPPTSVAVRSGGQGAMQAMRAAADILDATPGARDHRAVLVRAALTDALAIAVRIQP